MSTTPDAHDTIGPSHITACKLLILLQYVWSICPSLAALAIRPWQKQRLYDVETLSVGNSLEELSF